jgi:hypothetical protein
VHGCFRQHSVALAAVDTTIFPTDKEADVKGTLRGLGYFELLLSCNVLELQQAGTSILQLSAIVGRGGGWPSNGGGLCRVCLWKAKALLCLSCEGTMYWKFTTQRHAWPQLANGHQHATSRRAKAHNAHSCVPCKLQHHSLVCYKFFYHRHSEAR